MAFYKRFRLRRGERHPALHPRRRWLRALNIGALILGSFIVMMYLVRVPVRNDLIRRVLAFAEQKGFQVNYRSVWGDLFGRINFSKLYVFQDEDHYFEAERVQLSYRLLPLITEQKLVIRGVNIVRPRARWLLPETTRTQEPFDPDFSLDLDGLRVSRGYVELADTLVFHDVELDLRLKVRPHQVEGRLRQAALRGELQGRERLQLRKATAQFSYKAPDTFHIKNLSILTSNSTLKGGFDLDGPSWGLALEELKLDMSELDSGNMRGELIAHGSIAERSTGYAGDLSARLTGFSTSDFQIADLFLSTKGDRGLFEISLAAQDERLGRAKGSGTLYIGKEEISAALNMEDVELYPSSGLPLYFKGLVSASYVPGQQKVSADVTVERLQIFPEEQCPMSFSGSLSASYEIAKREGQVKGMLQDIHIQTADLGSCRFDLGFSGNAVEIRDFVIQEGLTRIAAQGVWTSDSITGKLDVASFQLANLCNYNPLGFAAELDAKLSLGGSVQAPILSGVAVLRPDTFFERANLDIENFNPIALAGVASVQIYGLNSLGGKSLDLSMDLRDSLLKLDATDREELALASDGIVKLDWEEKTYEYECMHLMVISGGDTIANRNPFILSQAGDSLYLGPAFFDVEEGLIGGTGSWRPGELPRFSLSLSNIQLATLGRMFNLPTNTQGTIWGQIAARDNLEGQTIYIDLGVSNLRIADIEADSFAFVGTLDAERLDFEASFLRGFDLSVAFGYMYYDLKNPALVKAFDVDISLKDIGVWPLAVIKDVVEVKEGVIDGHLKVSGTPTKPDVAGWLKARDALLYVPLINLTGKDVYVYATLDKGKLILDTLRGKVVDPRREKGKEGTIMGRGDYALFTSKHRFYFGFMFKDVLFSPERRLHALCNGNITIEGTEVDPLEVKGKINVSEAVATYELWDEFRFTGPLPAANPNLPPPPPAYLDLEITGDRNIWLSNNWMDIELSANLQVVQRDEPYPRVIGSLEARRGNVYYLDHTLRLERGSVIFPPTQALDPELDIWAYEITNTTYTVSGSARPVKVILHMGGTLTQPLLEFFSDPPIWSESEIIQYLNFNLAPTDIATDVGTTLSETFLAQIARGGSQWVRQRLNLDIFSIEAMGEEPTKVTLGKYIGDRWFASYTYAVEKGGGPNPNPNQHEFTVQYQIGKRRNQEIVLDRDEEGKTGLRYQIRIRY